MKIRVKYRRARVTVECNKPTICQACGKKGKIDLHHYRYVWKTKYVRENPIRALDNAVWLCYQCHRIADAIRKLDEDMIRQSEVVKILDVKSPTATKLRS